MEVGTGRVFPKIQELGWRTVKPAEPVEVTPGMILDIEARRSPLLHVTDAASRAPIEKFSVMLGRTGSGGNWLRGEMNAPQGILPLLYDSIDESSYRGQFILHVWAEGFAEFERDIPDLLVSEDIEAALLRGSASSASGYIRRKGVAVKDAKVTLNTGFLVTNNWKPDKLSSVSSGVSDADGAFSLAAPSGPYVLLVRSESTVYSVSVQVPCSSLMVDLEDLAEVLVRARDHEGASAAGVVVLLQALNGRQWYETTDSAGKVFQVHSGDLGLLKGPSSAGPNEYTTRRPGSRFARWPVDDDRGPDDRTERSPQPLAAKLSIHDCSSLDGCQILGMSNESLTPDANGNLTLSSRGGLRVTAPWGDIWWFHTPKDVGSSWDVQLDLEGLGLDGIGSDLTTGRPLAGVDIQTSGGRTLKSKSDSEGRFRLRGLEPAMTSLSFSRGDGYSVGFEPLAKPSSDPPFVRVAIPRTLERQTIEGLPNRKITGRLLDSVTSGPHATATIFARAVRKVSEGTLVLWVTGCTTTSDSEGRYTLIMPQTTTYRADFVTRRGPESKVYQRDWTITAPGDAVMDFKFP